MCLRVSVKKTGLGLAAIEAQRYRERKEKQTGFPIQINLIIGLKTEREKLPASLVVSTTLRLAGSQDFGQVRYQPSKNERSECREIQNAVMLLEVNSTEWPSEEVYLVSEPCSPEDLVRPLSSIWLSETQLPTLSDLEFS